MKCFKLVKFSVQNRNNKSIQNLTENLVENKFYTTQLQRQIKDAYGRNFRDFN